MLENNNSLTKAILVEKITSKCKDLIISRKCLQQEN